MSALDGVTNMMNQLMNETSCQFISNPVLIKQNGLIQTIVTYINSRSASNRMKGNKTIKVVALFPWFEANFGN